MHDSSPQAFLTERSARPRGSHPLARAVPGDRAPDEAGAPLRVPVNSRGEKAHPGPQHPAPPTVGAAHGSRCQRLLRRISAPARMGIQRCRFIRHYWGHRRCFLFLRRLICLSWAGHSAHHQVVPCCKLLRMAAQTRGRGRPRAPATPLLVLPLLIPASLPSAAGSGGETCVKVGRSVQPPGCISPHPRADATGSDRCPA